LSVRIGGVTFPNPITVASGTFGTKDEFKNFVDVNQLGAVITKTITWNPRVGNPMPRITEVAAGMLNAIGLQNKGIEHFTEEIIPYFSKIHSPLVVSIAGESEEEYYRLARELDGHKTVKALEINLSCPNVKKGCLVFQSNAEATKRLISNIRHETSKLLFTKLSPESGDNFLNIARAAIEGGTDGLSLINTIKGMAVDLRTRRPRLANITGGLSGPAIKPVALRYLYETKKNFKIPVIAMGGIMTTEDALEFLMVGADLVAVGTGNFVEPAVSLKILKGVEDYLVKEELTLNEFRGSLKI
jgi:dihydroorotate dehydrogenase (NAD+) catalytic subunit